MTDTRIRPIQVAIAVAFAAVLALPFMLRTGEKRPDGAPANETPGRKLVIITPHWDGIRTEFSRAFSAWTERNLGHATRIEWMDVGGTSEAIRYVKSEFDRSPEGIGIDLFFGGGVDPYIQLAKANRLAVCSLPDEVLARVPGDFNGVELYDPDRRWFGACLAGFGILYNRKVCDTLKIAYPATWEDLAKPQYFTWVGSGDPRSSGSLHMIYEIILQAYGWEKGWSVIVRMCANTRNFSRAAADVPKDTAVGEVACGICIDSMGWRQIAEVGSDRMAFVLPEGVTAISPDSVAVLKGAPARDLAEQFVRFVMSVEGQKLWILKPGAPGGPIEHELDRMPVIPGLAVECGEAAALKYDAFKTTGTFRYSSATGSARWTALNDLLGSALIDVHSELSAAWSKVKDLPETDPRRIELVKPPVTEQELMALATGKWQDAAFRTRMCAEWANGARERYKKISTTETQSAQRWN